MTEKVIVVLMLLAVSTALMASKTSRTKSKTSMNDPCSSGFDCKLPGRRQQNALDEQQIRESLDLEDCQSKCNEALLRESSRRTRKRRVAEECLCYCLQFHNASCPSGDVDGPSVEGFICLENEAESCGLKQKTLNRFPLEDLDGANSVEECQDVCEAAVRKRRKTKKQTEQCNCLCNYYSVCLRGSGSFEGSAIDVEETRMRTKSKKTKTGSRDEIGSGSNTGIGELYLEETHPTRSKKN